MHIHHDSCHTCAGMEQSSFENNVQDWMNDDFASDWPNTAGPNGAGLLTTASHSHAPPESSLLPGHMLRLLSHNARCFLTGVSVGQDKLLPYMPCS